MSLSVELSGRTKKGLYHVVINPRPGEDVTMTKEQWYRAAEILEEERGFTGQKRIMVLHKKHDGRLHMHVAYERMNHKTGLILCNKHSRFDETRARRKMEIEFGHVLTDEKNKERPALKLLLGDLWAKHLDGNEFLKAVEKAGYIIAKQEHRRPFAIINSKGRSFELIKEIPGVRTRQVRERLKGISLPDKKQVLINIKSRRARSEKRKTRDEIADELKQSLYRDPQKSKGRGR